MSASIATDYGLEDRVRFPAGARNVSLLPIVQTGSRVHPASYQISRGVKRPEREANHSPPFSDEIVVGGAVPPLSRIYSWRSASLNNTKTNLPYRTFNYISVFSSVFEVMCQNAFNVTESKKTGFSKIYFP
jgi:hypothetical protein